MTPQQEEEAEMEYCNGFEDDVNPLRILRNTATELQDYSNLLSGSDSLDQFHQEGIYAQYRNAVGNADNLLQAMSKHVSDTNDVINDIISMLNESSACIRSRLEETYVPFDAESHHLEKHELEQLEKDVAIRQRFVDLQKEMLTLQERSSDLFEKEDLLAKSVTNARNAAMETIAVLDAGENKGAVENGEVESESKEEDDQDGLQREQKEEDEEEKRVDKTEELLKQQELEAKAKEEAELKRKTEQEVYQRKLEEEKRRKSDEEKRKKMEQDKRDLALKRKQEEEVDKMAANPSQWQVYTYPIYPDEDCFRSGVGCVVRTPEDSFAKAELAVKVIDHMLGVYELHEHEESVSNMIEIAPARENETVTSKYGFWLAMPVSSARSAQGKETVCKIQFDEDGEWETFPAREANIEEHSDTRLVECRVKSLRAPAKVQVLTRLRRDTEVITPRGGALRSYTDQRVVVTFPQRSVRLSTKCDIKVCSVDSTMVSDTKTWFDGCDSLRSCSPLLHLDIQHPLAKPATVTLPAPSGGSSSSNNRPKTSIPTERRSQNVRAMSAKLPSNKVEDDADDAIYLLVRQKKGDWFHDADTLLVQKRESVSFDIDSGIDRLILLRCSSSLEPPKLTFIITHLEKAIHLREVCVILRQSSTDMEKVVVDLTRPEKAERLIEKLADEGFDQGGPPSKGFMLKESSQLRFRFRGNIRLVHDENESSSRQNIDVAYNSQKNTARQELRITERDKFAQHALATYRGHLQVFGLSRLAGGETKQDGLLCELPLVLPKGQQEHAVVAKATVSFSSNGPLSSDYLDDLSHQLRGDFKQLAAYLDISKPRIQSICQNNIDAPTHVIGRQMLEGWLKTVPVAKDKVALLLQALERCGMVDLASDLRNRNVAFEHEKAKKAQEETWQRAIRIILDSSPPVASWHSLGIELGLSFARLKEIETNEQSPRSRCAQVLTSWREQAGDKATRRLLVRKLKRLNFKDVALKVEQLR